MKKLLTSAAIAVALAGGAGPGGTGQRSEWCYGSVWATRQPPRLDQDSSERFQTE